MPHYWVDANNEWPDFVAHFKGHPDFFLQLIHLLQKGSYLVHVPNSTRASKTQQHGKRYKNPSTGKNLPFNTYLEPGRPYKEKRTKFPQVGDLTAYLLAVDFVYHGHCLCPSLEDLSKVVADLNKGAVHAMQHLGIVSQYAVKNDKVMKSQVRTDAPAAFQELYREVAALWQQTDKQFDFDMFVLEHTLCKMQKFKGAHMYKY